MDWRWRSWNANPRSSKSSSSIYHQIFNSCRHNSTVNNNWFTSHKIVLIQTTDSNHYGYAIELLLRKFYCIVRIKYVPLAKWLVCIHTDCLAFYFLKKECDAIDPTENRPSLPPQRKSQSRAKAAILSAPRENSWTPDVRAEPERACASSLHPCRNL